MIWNIILIFFSLIIVNYILKIIKRQTFFKTHGIPHETAVPIFGNILPVITRKKGLADIVKKLCDTNSNAKYCGFYDFTNPVIILRDHELVKSVLIKNFESFTDHGILGPETSDQLFVRNLFNLKGEKWHDVRNLLSPAFTSSKMKIFYKLISKSTINFVDGYLINDAKGNEMREMKEAFSRYINDVITSCAFGIYINTMKDLKNNFYIIGKEATNFAKFYLKIILMRGFPILMKLLRVKLLNSKINKFFHETIRSTINMRDKMGITRPDILQILMNARGNEMKIDLTPEEITAQAFLIYFAAYDTTTTCLSFMTHELAINPEIQSRLQDEIDSVFHKTNGDPSYDAINELEYLEAVINETTRKYPIFASLDRVCTKQFNLPPAVPGAKSVVVKPAPGTYFPEKVRLDKAPEFSFGHRTPLEKPNETPAPGTYCPEKVDFGKGPQYSLTGKGYIDKLDNLPAPGTYSPEKVNLFKSLQFTFGLRTLTEKPNDSPAPGTYCPEKVYLNRGPEYSLYGKGPTEKPNDVPAPGTYCPEKVNLNKGPEYSLYGKGQSEKPNDVPAPGTYSPEKFNLNKGPEYSLYGKGQSEKPNDLPAPGTYSPEKFNLNKGPEYSLYGKGPAEKPNDIPAPGTYSPEKVNLNKGPEYSLYGKGPSEKPNDIPAPGTYSPEKVNLNKGPEYSLYGKGLSEKPNDIPAPGTYSPEKVNLNKGPEYSLYGKGAAEKLIDTPAPGTYSPERINLNKGPEYSLYGKPAPTKMSENPAPGTYSPEKLNLDKGPEYSLTGKGPSTKPSDIPGPGEYCPEKAMLMLEKAFHFTFGLRSPMERLNSIPGPGAYEAIKPDAIRSKSPAYSISARFQLPNDHSQKPGPGAHCPEKVHLDYPPAHTFGIRHSQYVCNLKDAVY
ncbi:cytochrome P450 3A9 isoform X10 [Leptopilina boulardi]|uniref:cytochrome P450 3A9 isoform X10 n=1 Tax=Leptopilina boulardi TaxID=63433 RepID=UPI0021F644FB|nr:cytochrome P450 3A9 isoform X10 [Leptopilina boulardi]